MSIMFKGIFPIKCYETILTDDFSKLKDFARNSKYKDALTNEMDDQTLVGSTDNRILEHPDLYYIKKTLMYHFNKFINSISLIPPYTTNIITTSWIARIKQGGFIHNHNHCNSWYSGLLYFDDDYTGATPLKLENPLYVFNHFDIEEEPDSFYSIIPEPNKIFFFPSYLKHMSDVQTGDKTRYSLAWNIYPDGNLGRSDSDSYLETKWLSS